MATSNNHEYEKEEAIQHLGPHHIHPHSRIEKGEENLYPSNLYPNSRWPPFSKKHKNWHLIFSNLTPEEVIGVVLEYINKDGAVAVEFFATHFSVKESWDHGNKKIEIEKKVNQSKIPKRRKAWEVVFGDMNGLEAVEWIEREFVSKVWLYDGWEE